MGKIRRILSASTLPTVSLKEAETRVRLVLLYWAVISVNRFDSILESMVATKEWRGWTENPEPGLQQTWMELGEVGQVKPEPWPWTGWKITSGRSHVPLGKPEAAGHLLQVL